jgi:hypothetical protein
VVDAIDDPREERGIPDNLSWYSLRNSAGKKHRTYIDGGRDHTVALFYATKDGAVWGILLDKNKEL